jgi:hypothetical protein
MNPRTLRIRRLLPQSCGGADRSSWSALLSEKYEKASSEAAATPNARLPNSAALPLTNQDSVAARPHKNPIGRQTQAIRRVRASTAEARSGLCFDLHHIGYRIPMPMPNDAIASNILRGESPTAIKIAGSGRSAKTVRPNRAFRRLRCRSYFCQLSPIGPIVESPLLPIGSSP